MSTPDRVTLRSLQQGMRIFTTGLLLVQLVQLTCHNTTAEASKLH